MTRIRVRAATDAPRGAVWTRLADIADHVEWMADARAIRFTSERAARSPASSPSRCSASCGKATRGGSPRW